jgi:tRNA (mo5U34)-methyltransferase
MSTASDASDSTIETRIASFPRWHYEFELDGHKTPIFDPAYVNRHRQRRRYFFDALLHACGGSLKGLRVLDLGCNAGFWSLAAIEGGCDFVYGVDGRAMHVEQANFVFEVNGVDPARYLFETVDVFALDPRKVDRFDIVLCLGLLYHVSRPFELVELIAAANDDLVVIDTDLARGARPLFEVKYDAVEELDSALTHPLVLHPTAAAVEQLLAAFGYQSVMLRVQFDDYTGAGDYERGERRAFIASKRRNLAEVALDREPIATAW